MPYIDTLRKEICFKLVYYGPGLGGKTESLKCVYDRIETSRKGQIISIKTETERTLFFDFVPLSLGKVRGLDLKFHFFTVPGQSFYNMSRKAILNQVDGIVFVADSQTSRREANIDSLENLYENLQSYAYTLDKIPTVMQYNKRDLKNILPVDVLNEDLNKHGFPFFESSALKGFGVIDAFKKLVNMVINDSKDTGVFPKVKSKETIS